MEFNIIDENNKFKLGNIISIFKLPNYDKEFVLFSISDFDVDETYVETNSSVIADFRNLDHMYQSFGIFYWEI